MKWARFVWRYISHRKDLLLALVACAVVLAVAELSIPWLLKDAIDAVLGEGAGMDLNKWLGTTLGVLAAVYLAHVLLLRTAAQMILHCAYNFRGRLFAHIHSQGLPFFQRHRTGELTHRVTSDAKIFETEVGRLVGDVPGELVVVIGVVILMVILHAGLALAVIAFMTVTAAVTAMKTTTATARPTCISIIIVTTPTTTTNSPGTSPTSRPTSVSKILASLVTRWLSSPVRCR